MKHTLFLIFTTLSLYAHITNLHVKYEGGISIYGRVGTAKVDFQEDNITNTYKMHVVMTTTGLVKKLTGNQVNSYTSEGVIKNGVYFPKKFVILVTKDTSFKRETYIFDHKNKKIEKIRYKKELVHYTNYDISSMHIISKEKTVKKREHKSIKYYRDDYLSLYLNIRHHNFTSNVLGYIDKKETDTVILNNKNFLIIKKHNGDDVYNIEITYDNTLLFQEALAKNILFFGDAYIHKILPFSNKNGKNAQKKFTNF